MIVLLKNNARFLVKFEKKDRSGSYAKRGIEGIGAWKQYYTSSNVYQTGGRIMFSTAIAVSVRLFEPVRNTVYKWTKFRESMISRCLQQLLYYADVPPAATKLKNVWISCY